MCIPAIMAQASARLSSCKVKQPMLRSRRIQTKHLTTLLSTLNTADSAALLTEWSRLYQANVGRLLDVTRRCFDIVSETQNELAKLVGDPFASARDLRGERWSERDDHGPNLRRRLSMCARFRRCHSRRVRYASSSTVTRPSSITKTSNMVKTIGYPWKRYGWTLLAAAFQYKRSREGRSRPTSDRSLVKSRLLMAKPSYGIGQHEDDDQQGKNHDEIVFGGALAHERNLSKRLVSSGSVYDSFPADQPCIEQL